MNNDIRREVRYTTRTNPRMRMSSIPQAIWAEAFSDLRAQMGTRINTKDGTVVLHPVDEHVQVEVYLNLGADICQFIPMSEAYITEHGAVRLGDIEMGTKEVALEDIEEEDDIPEWV